MQCRRSQTVENTPSNFVKWAMEMGGKMWKASMHFIAHIC